MLHSSELDLRTLDVPGLVKWFSGGELADGRRYEVLEWICGRSVEESYLGGDLDESDIVGLVKSISNTLDICGQIGLLHGDVKRSNIIDRGRLTSTVSRFVLVDLGMTSHLPPGNRTDWIALGRLVGLINQPLASSAHVEKWHALVKGLVNDGWTKSEVDGWLEEFDSSKHEPESRQVQGDAAERISAHSVTWITFAGHSFSADPRALADALGTCWDEALNLISSGVGREQLEDWSAQFLSAELTRVVNQTSPRSRLAPEAQLCRLIHALWNLPLGEGASVGISRYWFRGLALDSKRIGSLALHAIQYLDATGSDGSIEVESDEALTGLDLIRGGLARVVANSPRSSMSVLAQNFTEGCQHVHAALRSRGIMVPANLLSTTTSST